MRLIVVNWRYWRAIRQKLCAISLRFCRALDFSPGCGITNMKRALPISGQLNSGLQNSFETVTWQWRFLLFTQIVMVKLPICTVSVIGMVLTCFIGNAANRLSVMAMLFPAPNRGFVHSRNEGENVRKPRSARCLAGRGSSKL